MKENRIKMLTESITLVKLLVVEYTHGSAASVLLTSAFSALNSLRYIETSGALAEDTIGVKCPMTFDNEG